MKKYIFILLFFPSLVFSQGTKQRIRDNLQKYWDYRARLEKYFVVAEASNDPGTNIPASDFGNDRVISYSDGNNTLPYYIGLLATEYILLKNNGLDYSHTRDLLKWALNAVDRLDLNAEKHFRTPEIVKNEKDLNGFFMRDDVDSTIMDKPGFPSDLARCYSIGSEFMTFHEVDFTDVSQSKNFINSRDMVWHYLLNLSLVVKLVDDEGIKYQAQYQAWRMVNNFHNWSIPLGTMTWWVIKNPVHEDWWVPGGGEVEVRALCEFDPRGLRYGFTKAGNWITQGSGLSDLWQDPVLRSKGAIHADFYSTSHWDRTTAGGWEGMLSTYILATIIGDQDYSEHYPIEYLVPPPFYHDQYLYDELKGFKDNLNISEHLPLIYNVLHGNDAGGFNQADSSDIKWYLNLFDKLQEVNEQLTSESPWWSDNRLIWMDASKQSWNRCNVSHIDYMLLYNLFWLTYIQDVQDNMVNMGVSCNEINIARNYILDISTVSHGCSLQDSAGNYIKLVKGFKALSGSSYKAKSGKLMTYEKRQPSSKTPTIFCKNSSCQKSTINEGVDNNSEIKAGENKVVEVKQKTVNISPNPSNGMFNIYIPSLDSNEAVKVFIFNLAGEIVLEKEVNTDESILDLSSRAKGIYICEIMFNDRTVTSKLIIE